MHRSPPLRSPKVVECRPGAPRPRRPRPVAAFLIALCIVLGLAACPSKARTTGTAAPAVASAGPTVQWDGTRHTYFVQPPPGQSWLRGTQLVFERPSPTGGSDLVGIGRVQEITTGGAQLHVQALGATSLDGAHARRVAPDERPRVGPLYGRTVEVAGERVRLDIGEADGVTPGAIYSLQSPDDPGVDIAQVSIITVEADHAWAELRRWTRPAQTGLDALFLQSALSAANRQISVIVVDLREGGKASGRGKKFAAELAAAMASEGKHVSGLAVTHVPRRTFSDHDSAREFGQRRRVDVVVWGAMSPDGDPSAELMYTLVDPDKFRRYGFTVGILGAHVTRALRATAHRVDRPAALARLTLGRILRETRRYGEARTFLSEALPDAEKSEARLLALNELLSIAREQHDVEAIERLTSQVVRLSLSMGQPGPAVAAQIQSAIALAEVGELKRTKALRHEADTIARKIEPGRERDEVRLFLSFVDVILLANEGKVEEALRLMPKLRELLDDAAEDWPSAEDRDNWIDTVEHFELSMLSVKLQAPPARIDALAGRRRAKGDVNGELHALLMLFPRFTPGHVQRLETLAEIAGEVEPWGLAMAHYILALLRVGQSDEEVRAHAEAAMKLFRQVTRRAEETSTSILYLAAGARTAAPEEVKRDIAALSPLLADTTAWLRTVCQEGTLDPMVATVVIYGTKGLAEFMARDGNLPGARKKFDDLKQTLAVCNPEGQSDLLWIRAVFERELGDDFRSEQILKEIMPGLDPQRQFLAQIEIARMARERRAFADAERALRRAQELKLPEGDRARGALLAEFASLEFDRGQLVAARRLMAQAVELARSVSADVELAILQQWLAFETRLGDSPERQSVLGRIQRLSATAAPSPLNPTQAYDKDRIAGIMSALAGVPRPADSAAARAEIGDLKRALAVARAEGDPAKQARLLTQLGLSLMSIHKHKEGHAHLLKAQSLLSRARFPSEWNRIECLLIGYDFAHFDFAGGRAKSKRLFEWATEHGDQLITAVALFFLSAADLHEQEWAIARSRLTECLRILEQFENREGGGAANWTNAILPDVRAMLEKI